MKRKPRIARVANHLQCFRYIVSFPPTPLTEEDIWFQIGHVHEQQKDVSTSIGAKTMILIYCSMTMPNLHIDVYLIVIQTMPKFFNNLAGFIINKATASAVKSMQLNTWKNLSAQ